MRALDSGTSWRFYAAWLLPAAVALAWLALALPPHAFYSGDPGLKLIAALNAVDHPDRPFELDLPRLGESAVGYLDPMMVRHDGHAHVLQTPLFPVLSAPFIAGFGLRGAYVLPGLSFLALLPLLNSIRRHTADRAAPAALAVLAVVANPMLFYALEFWEHAPAVTLLAAATALLVSDGFGAPAVAWRRSSLAGLCAGLAILLRPEAVWYVVPLALVDRRRTLAFGAGAAVPLAFFFGANLAHSGSILGPHTAANLAPLRDDWLNTRRQRLVSWVWPSSVLEGAGLLLIAAAWAAAAFRVPLGIRQTIGLSGAAIVAFMASQLWIGRDSFWQAFPIAALALVPVSRPHRARALWAIVGVAAVGVIATATHSGGAQWGARFLLITSPALLVIASVVLTEAFVAGPSRVPRIALTLLIVLCAIATSRVAYRELRGAKRAYARVVQATAVHTPTGGTVVTSVWWFDQVVAVLHGTRTFLYARDAAQAREILTELAASGVLDATLVWTTDGDAFSMPAAAGDTCFHVAIVDRLPVGGLIFGRARCGTRAEWATNFPFSSPPADSRWIGPRVP